MDIKPVLPKLKGNLYIMTERDGHHLKKILKNDRKITLEELHKDFINSTSTYISKIL